MAYTNPCRSLVLLLFTAGSIAGQAVEVEIAKIEEANRQLEIRNDFRTIMRNWADNCLITGVTGMVVDKGAVLAMLEKIPLGSFPEFRLYEKENLKVIGHGDTAISSFLLHAEGKADGKDFVHRFQTTNVWVKTKQGWRLVATQSSDFRPPGAAK